MFIVFEGVEGSGKSTQARLLFQKLNDKGIPCILTREPGGTPNAELIRSLLVTGETDRWRPETDLLLMMAARVEHWYKHILVHLEKGYWVICDRFILSTLAYQGYGFGIDINFIKEMHERLIPGARPDKTIILDLDFQIALRRAEERKLKEDRFEKFGLDFHEKIYNAYKELALSKNCILINAENDIQKIHEEIMKNIE